MNKEYNIGFFFAVLLFGLSFNMSAQTVEQILSPSDDTYIYGNSTVRGMEPLLKVYHSVGPEFRRIIFLKFDISRLSPHLESAKLRLYCEGFAPGGDNAHQLELYPVRLSNWAEDDISYTNYVSKLGSNVDTPVLAGYTVAKGVGLEPQYIEFAGSNLLKLLQDSVEAGVQFVSFRLRERLVVKSTTGAAVIVDFHSKENASGFTPELVVEEKQTELSKLSSVFVDEIALNDFNESIYRYVVKLSWDATVVPLVSAIAKYEDASVTISQASTVQGTEAQRTARIVVTNQDSRLSYSVVFETLPPPTDARLARILVNDSELEFFNKDKSTYTVYLPYTTQQLPQLSAETFDPFASAEIVPAQGIDRSLPEVERSAIVKVTSANGEVIKNYIVIFEKLPELDIFLGAGQSNMAGRGSFADVTAPMQEVFLLTPDAHLEIASNPLNKYANIRKDISVQKLGPTYTFSLKVQETTRHPIALVVNALGGSSITSWYEPGKTLYDATIVRAKQAQRFGRIKAILWHQGESDSGNTSTYMPRLKSMVEHFRADLNEPDLFFVAGELAYWRGGGTASTAFNNMIRTIGDHIPNSGWVSAEGLTPLIDVNDPHFSGESQKVLGERYADKVISALYTVAGHEKRESSQLVFLQYNPKSFTVHNQHEKVKLKVHDLTGRLIDSTVVEANESKSFSFVPGIYFLSVFHQDIKSTYVIMQ